MMFCEREQEVLDLIRAGRSPEECETVAEHVRSCAACTDLVAVASTILSDEMSTVRSARIPTSGVMWWRMQRRARQEGAMVTRRALTLVQGITVLLGALIAVPLIGVLSPEIDWTAFAKQFPLALLLVVTAILTPAAVYFATSRD
jgi:hypothetical protein